MNLPIRGARTSSLKGAATPPTKRTSSFWSTVTSPGHRRAVLLRRCAAGMLVVAGLLSAAHTMTQHPEVVVFARSIPAGSTVHADDLKVVRMPGELIPEASVKTDSLSETSEQGPIGRIVVAAAGEGEVVTESKLLSQDLTNQLVSNITEGNPAPQAHMVPLKLAEPDIIPLLTHGDTVNIVGLAATPARTPDPALRNNTADRETVASASDTDNPGSPIVEDGFSVIATGGRVVSTSLEGSGKAVGKPATILIALPAEQAARVASHSLEQPLTVVITGDRADEYRAIRTPSENPG